MANKVEHFRYTRFRLLFLNSGGPVIDMKYGRKDATSPKDCVDEGNLPAGDAPFPDADTPQVGRGCTRTNTLVQIFGTAHSYLMLVDSVTCLFFVCPTTQCWLTRSIAVEVGDTCLVCGFFRLLCRPYLKTQ